jgi:hypothetical protein
MPKTQNNEFQELLRKAQDQWLGLGDTDKINIEHHELQHLGWEGRDNPALYYLRIMRKPENFGFTCKHVFNIELLPEQLMILKMLWTHSNPMYIAARGFGKSFTLALYSMLVAVFKPGSKVIIAGAGFRQSKNVMEIIENIWNNAPVLRDLCGAHLDKRQRLIHEPDKWLFRIGASTITGIPIGDGGRIRGFRATNLILDEFATINPEIYETVLRGFASVTASPIQNVKRVASMKYLQGMGLPTGNRDEIVRANQVVLAGTAYWTFNHFYKYWKLHHNIISARNDVSTLERVLGENGQPDKTNSNNYCIIRIPYDLVPDGFMDADMLASSQATMSRTNFLMEYGVVWGSDTQGYFSRKLIESCVTSKPIEKPSGSVKFESCLSGDPGGRYVIGVDPASEVDNFAITVLELHKDHRRLVYCWTTKRSEFRRQKAQQEALASDFYGHCARKIRELMKAFPTVAIALDAQGSVGVQEALESNFMPGELPILPIHDIDNPRPTDNMAGLHIIHLIQFAKQNWVLEANEGLKHDLEQKNLLFPRYDNAGIALAMDFDNRNKEKNTRFAESLESCMQEIEDLKDELATIVVTELPSGRLRWDTPEIKTADNKKGRLRKDRYSSLLLSNGVARKLMYEENKGEATDFIGGAVYRWDDPAIDRNVQKGAKGMYVGPDNFREAAEAIINLNNIRRR